MNDSNPIPPNLSLPKLNPVTVCAALGSPARWAIVQFLADGREASISQAAALSRCTPENSSKHLAVLLKAGVVQCRAGADRRHSLFFIPAARRPAPGVLDFGICKVDLKQG